MYRGDYANSRLTRALSAAAIPKLALRFLLVATFLALCILSASNCGSRSPRGPLSEKADLVTLGVEPDPLPDAQLTPGDVLNVTRNDICTKGYTKKIREVSASIKRHVYDSYKRIKAKGICCEVDHLIPLELGGSNREKNLWPEPYQTQWNAKAKDRLEGRLHKLVCEGSLDLAEAQREIAANWIVAYKKYLATPNSTRKHGRR